ncbi:MAG: glutamine--fructose-6-phosphate transaminase (isomerizing) [Candidatus Kerfeldbacteria bacterium]|nr:glutamine--fructose-6-phosphate transaminase (isomerizing) [Candidatus Kerfeldbacteria bacterium]
MCGIIGYVGTSPAKPIILEGLKRMEYRGYDSAGIAVFENGKISSEKKAGKLQVLTDEVSEDHWSGTAGIGHIRWATHGIPNDVNAHPHTDCTGKIYLIHNGIIENFHELRERLTAEGHEFTTQTDTEVLTHLIESHLPGNSLSEAVKASLKEVIGTYGLAVVSEMDPDTIVAARLGSPLILGIIGDGEYMIASDATAILPHTREVIYLDEGEVVTVNRKGFTITTVDNTTVEKNSSKIEWDIQQAEKQGYDHFMLKEIMEIPRVIEDGLRGRLIIEDGIAHFGGFLEYEDKWRSIERIVIVACGGAAIASRVGEYMLEEYASIPVKVEIGSEFRYRKPVLDEHTAVVIVSQSGETADTIASLREAKRQGVFTFGIVNVVGSTIAREVDAGMYIHAGPEVAVASTKVMSGMVAMFSLLTLAIGRQRGMSLVTGKRIAKELQNVSLLAEKMLKKNTETIKSLAKKYATYDNAFFLGRKYNMPSAFEGALKFKEIAYVHAEGYPSGELKHGPLALLDDRFFVCAITPKDSVYEKNLSNIQEVRARKGVVLALATEGDTGIEQYVDDVIYMPKTLEMLTPILSMIVVQLLAYYTAVERKCDIDQPRNLAKSVTVE